MLNTIQQQDMPKPPPIVYEGVSIKYDSYMESFIVEPDRGHSREFIFKDSVRVLPYFIVQTMYPIVDSCIKYTVFRRKSAYSQTEYVEEFAALQDALNYCAKRLSPNAMVFVLD